MEGTVRAQITSLKNLALNLIWAADGRVNSYAIPAVCCCPQLNRLFALVAACLYPRARIAPIAPGLTLSSTAYVRLFASNA